MITKIQSYLVTFRVPKTASNPIFSGWPTSISTLLGQLHQVRARLEDVVAECDVVKLIVRSRVFGVVEDVANNTALSHFRFKAAVRHDGQEELRVDDAFTVGVKFSEVADDVQLSRWRLQLWIKTHYGW